MNNSTKLNFNNIVLDPTVPPSSPKRSASPTPLTEQMAKIPKLEDTADPNLKNRVTSGKEEMKEKDKALVTRCHTEFDKIFKTKDPDALKNILMGGNTTYNNYLRKNNNFNYLELAISSAFGADSFILDHKVIRVNRELLAVFCDYFNSMSHFKESKDDKIEIKDLPFEIDLLEEAIDYCYGIRRACLDIKQEFDRDQHLDRALDLLKIAQFLGNSTLMFEILHVYREKIPLENLLEIFSEAKNKKNETALNFLIGHFINFSLENSFICTPDQFLTDQPKLIKKIVNENSKMLFFFEFFISSKRIGDIYLIPLHCSHIVILTLRNCDQISFDELKLICSKILPDLPLLKELVIDYGSKEYNQIINRNFIDDILGKNCKNLKSVTVMNLTSENTFNTNSSVDEDFENYLQAIASFDED